MVDIENSIGEFPPHFVDARNEFREQIKYLLSYCQEDDWDQDGAIAVTDKTIEQVIPFVKTIILEIAAEAGIAYIPDVHACKDGGIDFSWNKGLVELLVHVKAFPNTTYAYYGLKKNSLGTEFEVNDMRDVSNPSFSDFLRLFEK